MKKSKLFAAALATTMFATAACGLIACDKDAGGLGTQTPDTPTGKSYTITFNPGAGATLKGNSNGTTLTIKTGTDGKLTGTMPEGEKVDHTFMGWALTSTATTAEITKTNYTSYVFKKDTPVYAVYTANGNGGNGGNGENDGVYTITLNVGAGTCSDSSLTTTGGRLTFLPMATPNDPSSYIFDGWYTAAVGGEKVTLNTPFTANGTIYAQYTPQGVQPPQQESDGELLVGGQTKLYLIDNTANIEAPIEGNTATYEYIATGVELNAGDVVSFKIKGEVLVDHATPTEGPRLWDTDSRHGATFNQAAGTFTVKSNSTGVFSICVRYYDTGTDAAHPCWSIEFTDGGVDTLVPGGLYLVGSGFANAQFSPTTELYIDPDEGLTITLSAGNQIKTCHCGSNGTGAVWDMGDNTKYKEVNGTNIDFSTLDPGMGNASVKSGTHTYKITYEDGMVVFTCLD